MISGQRLTPPNALITIANPELVGHSPRLASKLDFDASLEASNELGRFGSYRHELGNRRAAPRDDEGVNFDAIEQFETLFLELGTALRLIVAS